jgi:hypothetical protein
MIIKSTISSFAGFDIRQAFYRAGQLSIPAGNKFRHALTRPPEASILYEDIVIYSWSHQWPGKNWCSR